MNAFDESVSLGRIFHAQAGEALPLDVSLYVAAELAARVSQLHGLGKAFGGFGPEHVKVDRTGAIRIDSTQRKGDTQPDMLSLGVAVYQLLSGKSIREAMELGAGTLHPPSAFNPVVDDELDAVIMAAVTPERSAVTAGALEEALYGVFEEMDMDPSPEALAPFVTRAIEAAKPKPKPAVKPKAVAVALPMRDFRLLDFSLVDDDEENPMTGVHATQESAGWLYGAVAMAVIMVGLSLTL